MKRHYFDLDKPSAFSSINQLARATNKSQKATSDWLAKQNVWQRHKPVRYRFPRRRTTGTACFTHVQADLADLTPLSRQNRGNRWMLVLIDCYSRFVMARPVHRKTGKDVAAALKDCFEAVNMHPSFLITDRGKEFYNSDVKDAIYPATLISPHSDMKASMAERMQRTIKTRMYKYFTHSGKVDWMNALPKIVNGINNSYHRIIRTTPQQVLDGKAEPAQPEEHVDKVRFKEGDRVRLALEKHIFRKGYKSQWTDEIFTIVRVLPTKPTTYHVIANDGKLIHGIFYSAEMVRV